MCVWVKKKNSSFVLKKSEPTRAVGLSSSAFVSATTFFPRSLTPFQAKKNKKQQQWSDQQSSQIGLAWRVHFALQRVTSWHRAINQTRLFSTGVTCRSVPLLSLRTTGLCLNKVLQCQASEAMYSPRVTRPKLCNYKMQRAILSLVNQNYEREGQIFTPPTPSPCSSSFNAPPPQ